MTMDGICTYGFVPMRAKPSEAAEMVSQILFGEGYHILEVEGRWARVLTMFDNYEGWVDAKLLEPQEPEEIAEWADDRRRRLLPMRFASVTPQGAPVPMLLSAGSEIFGIDADTAVATMCGRRYDISGIPSSPPESNPARAAVALLGTPYLWGGRTAFGIDCSGLVQVAFKMCRKALPRDTSEQVLLGRGVSTADVRTGDLAFFQKPSGRVCHVGICMGGGQIVHASGSVRIDTLDEKGIYNAERQEYTHKLLCIRRLRWRL